MLNLSDIHNPKVLASWESHLVNLCSVYHGLLQSFNRFAVLQSVSEWTINTYNILLKLLYRQEHIFLFLVEVLNLSVSSE
jgi:hypothetical protein